jgi:hypothetical protein
VLSFGVSIGLRYNALVLAAPLLALMVWRPFLDARPLAIARVLVVSLTIASLGLAWASTQWRLPDGQRLPNTGGFGGAQLFDVIGVSACSGWNYLPSDVTLGRPITVDQLRSAYDARHLQQTIAPKPGVPPMVETDAGGEIPRIWRQLVFSETRCYLDHRRAVFVEQMGMAKRGLFYATHATIDANPYGLVPAHKTASLIVSQHVIAGAQEPWRRPYLLYLAAMVLAPLAALSQRRLAPLFLAMLAGALAYPAVLFVAAPAADARYIFPSSILALVTVLASLGILAASRTSPR